MTRAAKILNEVKRLARDKRITGGVFREKSVKVPEVKGLDQGFLRDLERVLHLEFSNKFKDSTTIVSIDNGTVRVNMDTDTPTYTEKQHEDRLKAAAKLVKDKVKSLLPTRVKQKIGVALSNKYNSDEDELTKVAKLLHISPEALLDISFGDENSPTATKLPLADWKKLAKLAGADI